MDIFPVQTNWEVPSLKLRFSPLKMDGWKMILSFWGPAYFQGLWLLVSESVTMIQSNDELLNLGI